MKTSAVYTPAFLTLVAYVHAASESCSNGVTVIGGSVSCSGSDCTVVCGGKSSKVAAPGDASCPGSVTATCNGQQVSISGAQGSQSSQETEGASGQMNQGLQSSGSVVQNSTITGTGASNQSSPAASVPTPSSGDQTSTTSDGQGDVSSTTEGTGDVSNSASGNGDVSSTAISNGGDSAGANDFPDFPNFPNFPRRRRDVDSSKTGTGLVTDSAEGSGDVSSSATSVGGDATGADFPDFSLPAFPSGFRA